MKKQLCKSNDKIWAGVCAGIADYFDTDPTLVRALFVLFAFFIGGGLLLYLILWVIMPPAPTDNN